MKALIKIANKFQDFTVETNKNIGSGLISLEFVVENEIHFNIPIYQRLYVWENNQIRTLLEDIRNAFLKNADEFYFLGGIMLSCSNSNKIDLVDGQQRFTTLWLICDSLTNENNELKLFTYFNNEPRIHFSIRDKAQSYLKDKDSFKEYLNEKGDLIQSVESEVSEIIPLATGRNIVDKIIEEFKKDINFNIDNFCKYIYQKVNLTYTFIPRGSDMNRVFEAMNNRGKQLELHEILKSKIIEKIDPIERIKYSLLWDSCSKMNTYIEKNIKDFGLLSWKELFGTDSFLYEEDIDGKEKNELINVDIIAILKNKESKNEKTIGLLEILNDVTDINKSNSNDEITESDYASKSVRSIISFPTFLIHVLRVYQINLGDPNLDSSEVNEKKLLDIFDVENRFSDKSNAAKFIELLWRLRVLFDKYIIKWIYDDQSKEEYHSIEYTQISKSILKNKGGSENEVISVQRIEVTDEYLKDLMKLQGMLYHSQEMTTQYWLTPFLHFLHSNNNIENSAVLNKLEIFENGLFYNSLNLLKLKDRTFIAAFKSDSELLENLVNTENYLSECKGTNYPNYIFYKLEYVLWKFRNEICKKLNLDIEKWNKFRLTAKNSVEHIFPQQTKDENKHIEYISNIEAIDFELNGKKAIDDFGNLVLLSPGMNSEYSNKPYKEKKGKFDSKQEIDSLKSNIIFINPSWDWKLAEKHRNEMIELINKYITQLTQH